MSARVIGKGEALAFQRARVEARVPAAQAAALKAIRYADPAAWICAMATASAIETATLEHDRVGVLVTSAEGPVEAMAAMREAARDGTSSPIRFPASNAGSLAGLTSIAFGFRGPTLVLTLPAARGVPVGLLLAEGWLQRGVVSAVVLTACARREGGPVARTLLLAAEGAAALDRERDGAWLTALAEEVG